MMGGRDGVLAACAANLSVHDLDARGPLPRISRQDGRVHVWRIAVGELPPADEAARLSLSPAERERAQGMVHPARRVEYVKLHALARRLLAACLDLPPAELQLGRGPHGKPFLSGPGEAVDLRFNLAHSGSLALLALCWGSEVGVDLEATRPRVSEAGLARRFFSPSESAEILGLSGGPRHEAFYRCWTRKEAYTKARGEGLARLFADFRVSTGAAPALIEDRRDPGAPGRWIVCDVPVPSPYFAACAFEAQPIDGADRGRAPGGSRE